LRFSLTDRDGRLRDELPAISTFLNRLLALSIELQNTLFAVFEELLGAKIEGAIASAPTWRAAPSLPRNGPPHLLRQSRRHGSV